jgi:hypothetical protein
MLITEQFVVLNMPKTGSTFVRTVISEIYRQRVKSGRSALLEELILPNINVAGRPHDQHGTFRQIPENSRQKTIVSVARNPYDKFVSTFQFRWWAQYPPIGRDELTCHFPHFPDISLDDYVFLNELSGRRKLPNNNKWNIGNQTVQFIRMYFKNPLEVLEQISPNYFEGEHYFNDMAKVVFLRHEKLNEDLASFLEKAGFSENEAAFCRAHSRINVTNESSLDRSKLWTARSLRYVEYNERFLFKMFASLGFHFEKPQLPAHI